MSAADRVIRWPTALALIRDRQRRSAQKLDWAHMLLNIDEGGTTRPRGRREPIPPEVRRAVFEREGVRKRQQRLMGVDGIVLSLYTSCGLRREVLIRTAGTKRIGGHEEQHHASMGSRLTPPPK